MAGPPSRATRYLDLSAACDLCWTLELEGLIAYHYQLCTIIIITHTYIVDVHGISSCILAIERHHQLYYTFHFLVSRFGAHWLKPARRTNKQTRHAYNNNSTLAIKDAMNRSLHLSKKQALVQSSEQSWYQVQLVFVR